LKAEDVAGGGVGEEVVCEGFAGGCAAVADDIGATVEVKDYMFV
jgi:hypothetical protein